jgi:hypothetical protein
MERITIEYRQPDGNWQEIGKTQNDRQMISAELREAKSRFPDATVRAVNSRGTVVDMM